MEKIRLCIGSDDERTIADSHMGDTQRFHLYDIFADGKYLFVGTRENSVKEMDHAQGDKMQRIIELLKEVDVFVARRKSPNFMKIAEKTRYQPVVVTQEEIGEIVAALGNRFAELDAFVTRRDNGERSSDIPTF